MSLVNDATNNLTGAKNMTTNFDLITVNDNVRSFNGCRRDLTGPGASYVEGIVIAIEEGPSGHDVYVIDIARSVFRGEDVAPGRFHALPPVNGARTSLGNIANGVFKI